MDLSVRHAIAPDILVDRLTVLLVVAESIEDLGEREMREPPDNFLGGDAKLPQLGDRPHRGASACYDGGSVKDPLGADNVRMACRCRHDRGLLYGGCFLDHSLWERGEEVNFAG